jgi:hypothetical protein
VEIWDYFRRPLFDAGEVPFLCEVLSSCGSSWSGVFDAGFVKQEATEDDKEALPLLTQNGELPLEVVSYEHIVLVSTLPYEVASLVHLHRERLLAPTFQKHRWCLFI